MRPQGCSGRSRRLEADVRAQLQRSAFSRVAELDISCLQYGELEINRDALARFG
jgi:type II restriction enzyme